MNDYLLSLVIFAPLVFAALLAFLPAAEEGQLRVTALVGMLISFGLTVWLYVAFDSSPGAAEFQFQAYKPWIEGMGIGYHVGVDGLAVTLMMLTAVLGPIVVLSMWSTTNRVKELFISLLVLQTAMYGTFAALDLALFYVFWEAMLVPMYLLIGVWGSSNRIYAAVKFFIYTFAASVLMLVAIIFLYVKTGTPDARSFDYFSVLNALNDPATHGGLTWEARRWLFLAFAVAFAVKVPMFPLHTWLPDAHTEAPAAGSIVLAGVLLKMGVFGFMRYAMPFFPDAAAWFRPALAMLAVVGILYGSLMSFTQRDMKKLVAYSSVAHLGFVMLGVVALTTSASTGAIYQMINHGVSTGALFLLIGLLYERSHTRLIADYGGIAKVTPMYAAAFFVVTLSSIGLPGTNGFIGEFMILVGAFNAPMAVAGLAPPAGVTLPEMNTPLLASLATLGVVLGAIYMLRMYQRVMLGPVRHPENRSLTDLNLREWMAVGPLLVLVVVMGVVPGPFLKVIEPSAERFVQRMTGQAVPVPALPGDAAAQQRLQPPQPPEVPEAPAQAPSRLSPRLKRPDSPFPGRRLLRPIPNQAPESP